MKDNNYNQEELGLVDINLIITVVIIGVLVISFLITENNKLKLSGEEPFWTEEEVKTLSVIIRFVLLIISFVSIYLSYQNIEILKKRGASEEEINVVKLEQIGAILASLAALFLFIATVQNTDENAFADVDVPEL